MCTHLVRGVGAYTIKLVGLSLLLAYLLSCIDSFRSFGIVPAAFPFTALGQYQPHIDLEANKSALQAAFDNFLLLFNCTFPGYSRLGSGIGMIASSFWMLHTVPKNCMPQRAVIGTLAGFVIGFRSMLMLTSSSKPVIEAAVCGAVFFAFYLLVTAGKKEIPPLPDASDDRD